MNREEAKARLLRMTEEQKADYEAFLSAAKGVTTARFAVIFSRLTPGTDWRRCSKSYIAMEWSSRKNPLSSRSLSAVTLDRIRAEIAKEPK